MFEILHPILDWLSAKQGSSPRSGYGWQVMVTIAIGVAGILKANEIRSKKISLKQTIRQQLSEIPLVAMVFTGEGAQAIRIHAKIEKSRIGYKFTIESSASASDQSQEFGSIEEVESFLETSAVFKLADFKPYVRQA